ncbi:MAG: hypothetical protein WKF89_15485 [Chitinophagaceae bacterium]
MSKGGVEKRKRFAYVDKSPDAQARCGNARCVPQPQQQSCGACLLFKGPVLASGVLYEVCS